MANFKTVTATGATYTNHVWITGLTVKAGANAITAKFYDHATAATGDPYEVEVAPGETFQKSWSKPGLRFHKGCWVVITGSDGRVTVETW